ncbi:MAG TPA: type II toxin-antitoxin system prevent-host-death family antitoxin [Terracidiphilus sp.]|jgi:prevent-host-death family protein|nr:type II toxin-antitoxin system prevent-host-death family antitoxin [Terracidiphilus sp.]
MASKTNGIRTINIHEAKTHLSRLVDEAEKGEPFIIAKAGKPKVKVTRLDAPEVPAKRRLGSLKGVFTLPDNFEEIDKELDKEIEKLMLGEDEE